MTATKGENEQTEKTKENTEIRSEKRENEKSIESRKSSPDQKQMLLIWKETKGITKKKKNLELKIKREEKSEILFIDFIEK